MQIDLQSMAIEMPPVMRHPNRAEFRGVLTLIDAPSDKAPAGARGHRVLLTRTAAEAALPSLLGMGLDYTPSLDAHDARRKVGIITGAEIVDGGRWSVAKATPDWPALIESRHGGRDPGRDGGGDRPGQALPETAWRGHAPGRRPGCRRDCGLK